MTVALHHVAEGPVDASVVVLAGSLGSTLDMWRPQLPALTAQRRVVRVDLRGHGGSTSAEGHYRVADLTADSIPGARLEVVEGAHLATIESADAGNALLTEHLGVSPAGTR